MNWLKSNLLHCEKGIDAVLQYEGISKRSGRLILLLIVVSTAIFRITTIDVPAIDRTAWKEIDYIMISKNFYREDPRFLYPRVSWPAEEPRTTAMELPVVPYLASCFYRAFGLSVFSVRLPTLLAFLLLIVYTYKLALREAGIVLGLLTAFFSALIPLFSEFRNFLFSEPALLFFSVYTIYQYAQWGDHGKKDNLIGAILGFSVALSLKPTSLYLLIPLLWIHFKTYRFDLPKYAQAMVIFFMALALPGLWYRHAHYLASEYMDVFGIFGGKFGGHDKFQTLDMLTDPLWYKTMIFRLRRLLLGLPGFLVILLGIILSFRKRLGLLFLAYLTAIGVFFAIVAEGQIDAPYRQLTIVPSASFFLALGAVALTVFVYQRIRAIFQPTGRPAALSLAIILCSIFLFSLPVRRPHFILPEDRSAPVHLYNWRMAEQIKKYARENSRIIIAGEYSIHKGGNDLSPVTYYYSGLTGWTLQEGEWSQAVIDSLKERKADLFAALHYHREPGLTAFLEDMAERYEVLYANPEEGMLLLSLRSEKNGKSTTDENNH
jgi:hypothetical protein